MGDGSGWLTVADIFIGFLIGLGVGWSIALVIADDDPPPADVKATVVVDATTLEMHGYGPDGKPGVFLYDCEHEDGPLVCTQREG